MKHNRTLFLLVLAFFAIICIAGSVYLQVSRAKITENNSTQANLASVDSSGQSISANNSSPADQTVSASQDTSKLNDSQSRVTLVPPMDNFNDRIWLNPFGNQPSKTTQIPDDKVSQYSDLICSQGKSYPGYHTGADLEVNKDELEKPVSVVSIADGIVRQAGHVNGYGGLVVIEHKINGQTYTAYYGHVDLSTVTVKAGDHVKVGQKIAELGAACSASNGNTRKHLHFGIHKGNSIVVAGYVTNKADLNNWVDPKSIIK